MLCVPKFTMAESVSSKAYIKSTDMAAKWFSVEWRPSHRRVVVNIEPDPRIPTIVLSMFRESRENRLIPRPQIRSGQ